MENVRPDSQKLTHLKAPDPIDSPMRVVSLPLHQLQNSQGETPGPMSVLEWRRAVWYAVQSIRDQTNPIVRPLLQKTCWLLKLNEDTHNNIFIVPNLPSAFN